MMISKKGNYSEYEYNFFLYLRKLKAIDYKKAT